MKIVYLDANAANPGDLTFKELEKLGDFTAYPRTSKEEVLERIADAEVVLTNKVVMTREIMEACRNMKYIGVTATGYNIVDLKAADELGIVVTNVPAYSTMSVAQFTFALLFAMVSPIDLHNRAVQAGEWITSPDFTFWNAPVLEMDGKTMGIIGFGSIGQRVGMIANALGMKVLYYSRHRKEQLENEMCQYADLDELFREADVISLHCPLLPETKEIINKENLDKMKKTAYLINTARGGCVNEKDLADALNQEKISGAAADVISAEPMKKDNPLLGAKNMVITPHIAWASLEARTRLLHVVAENIKAYQEGKPQNQVHF